MFFPSHPSPIPLTLYSQVEYCLGIGDLIIVDCIFFFFFLVCFALFGFFLRGRGGEGRGGEGRGVVVRTTGLFTFLVLILADGGGWQALK